MKLITWTYNTAFRKKAAHILAERPDILIVPECECPEKLIFKSDIPKPSDVFWYGENPNKGIGVFTYGNFRIIPHGNHHPSFRYVIPLSVDTGATTITLLAVWTQRPDGHDNYGSQVWHAIHYYSDLLQHDRVIIAGDFNSSSIWDKPNRQGNHSGIVRHLKDNNIESTYQHFYQQPQGSEPDPTLYLHRKVNRPYHIDYCFASESLIHDLSDVRVGTYEHWVGYSDHVPLMVSFGGMQDGML